MRTLPFGRSVRRTGGAGVIFGITLAVGAVASTASAGTVFTWDPAAAYPGLAGPFTADAIDGLDYLYDIGPKANPSSVNPVSFIEQITGFTLNGLPVATPGLNGTPGAAGSYGHADRPATRQG